jgi:hypothetical protein
MKLLPLFLLTNMLCKFSSLKKTLSLSIGRRTFGKTSSLQMSLSSNYEETLSPKLSVTASSSRNFSGDLIVFPFYKPNLSKEVDEDGASAAEALKEMIPADISADLKALIVELIDEKLFKAEASSKQLVRITGTALTPLKYIALIGLGNNETFEIEKLNISLL